jgi:hypothetical protein
MLGSEWFLPLLRVLTFPNNQVQEFVIPLQCSIKPLLLSICRLFYYDGCDWQCSYIVLQRNIQAKWRKVANKHSYK